MLHRPLLQLQRLIFPITKSAGSFGKFGTLREFGSSEFIGNVFRLSSHYTMLMTLDSLNGLLNFQFKSIRKLLPTQTKDTICTSGLCSSASSVVSIKRNRNGKFSRLTRFCFL